MGEARLLLPQSAVVVIPCGTDCGVEFVRPSHTPHWVGERVVILKGPTSSRICAARHIWDGLFERQRPTDHITCKLLIPSGLLSHVVGAEDAIAQWSMPSHPVMPNACGTSPPHPLFPGTAHLAEEQTPGTLDDGLPVPSLIR